MLTAINTEKPAFKFSPETDGEFMPVDSFLDKPVRSEDLLLKVEELLAQKTSRWQNWPEKSRVPSVDDPRIRPLHQRDSL